MVASEDVSAYGQRVARRLQEVPADDFVGAYFAPEVSPMPTTVER